jgi:uncharacterized protein YndB with AHSA1/START domain
VTEPLSLAFEVACSAPHAFTVWTSQIGTWWPSDHTVTGRGDLEIVLEGAIGGRIYERTPEGEEHDWGEVTVWEPPTELGYRWHLGRDRTDATEVEIRFVDRGTEGTRIEIEHRGWDRLGADAGQWRDRNRIGWESVLPQVRAALEKGVG